MSASVLEENFTMVFKKTLTGTNVSPVFPLPKY